MEPIGAVHSEAVLNHFVACVPASSPTNVHVEDLAAVGKALLIVSGDIEELMLVCDRILVVVEGNVTGEFLADAWSKEKLMAAIFAGAVKGVLDAGQEVA